jgi:hypothetical protein
MKKTTTFNSNGILFLTNEVRCAGHECLEVCVLQRALYNCEGGHRCQQIEVDGHLDVSCFPIRYYKQDIYLACPILVVHSPPAMESPSWPIEPPDPVLTARTRTPPIYSHREMGFPHINIVHPGTSIAFLKSLQVRLFSNRSLESILNEELP